MIRKTSFTSSQFHLSLPSVERVGGDLPLHPFQWLGTSIETSFPGISHALYNS